jgi:UDP-glucose 6-dehydrogenase
MQPSAAAPADRVERTEQGMKVSVIGVGHVGLVTAACMADLGHDVVGMDDDARKIEVLQAGEMPFYEQGLAELTQAGVDAGRLRFTTDAAEAAAGADVVFISVGTPTNADGSPHLGYVQAAAASVAAHATGPVVVAEKSTVPVRTGERIRHALTLQARAIGSTLHHDVVSNPEFLREGTAVEDTLRPDRLVVGADSDRAHAIMRELYQPLLARHDCPYVATDVRTAELIKHASNAFLATKISFINAVARICELAGADVETVADAMGHDVRIGRAFLNAGLGYGGSCLVPEETVLVRRDGVVRHLRMDELFALASSTGLSGMDVLAWDPERQRSAYLPLEAVTARPYRGDVVEVRTKMGRRLRTTADHPFVVGDGRTTAIEVKLASELTTEDWLPLAGGVPERLREEDRAALLLEAVGAGLVGASDVIGRMSAVDAARVGERARELPAPRRYDAVRGGTIRLDELEGLGITPFGEEGVLAANDGIPDAVWAAPVDHKRALLRGLWDGDGSWSLINGGPSAILEYGTVSRRLADGMLRLLAELGIVASMRTGRTAKSTVDTYWLRISGADQVEASLFLFGDEEAEQIRRVIAGQAKRISPTGYRKLTEDTAWVRVTDLRREEYDGVVFSLEVPGAHTVVSSGGLVTHNCFPKDVKAFIHIAAELGYDFGMLRETERINREAKTWPLHQLRRLVWNIADKEICVLGVAFKPGTDDVRDAPALDVIEALLAEGAKVRIHDPVALGSIEGRYPEVSRHDKAEDALRGAHAVVMCTEWDEYRTISPERLAELLEYPIVVDARNVWDPEALAAAGLTFASVGTAPQAVPGA